jgi:hypothetical protein
MARSPARARGYVASLGGAPLQPLSVSGPVFVGMPAVLTIQGARAGSTLTASGLPSGLTLNSAARTITGTVLSSGTINFTLTETLAGAAGSPKANALQVSASQPARAAAIGENTTATLASAQRILRAAQRGIAPITNVMATPPTLAEGAAGVASTLNGNAVGAPRYSYTDTSWYTSIGVTQSNSSLPLPGQDVSTSYIAAVTRRAAHGNGIAFITDAPAFDFVMGGGLPSGYAFTIYVTDLTTGIRARVAANDLTVTITSGHYQLVTFADARLRLVEIYRGFSSSAFGSMSLYGVNVASSYSVWRVRQADEPRIAAVGDSWWDTGGSVNTNSVKLLVPDFVGEQLGCQNPLSLGQSGSGFVNRSGSGSSAKGTFYERIANGDIDVARIGSRDLVIIPPSTNDDASGGAGFDDASVAAAMVATLQLARRFQPTAILATWTTPGVTKAAAYSATRAAANLAACQTVAANDPGFVYIDNSASGENWLFGTSATGNVPNYYGTDQNHLNDFGQASYGRRAGRSLANAIRSRFGL